MEESGKSLEVYCRKAKRNKRMWFETEGKLEHLPETRARRDADQGWLYKVTSIRDIKNIPLYRGFE